VNWRPEISALDDLKERLIAESLKQQELVTFLSSGRVTAYSSITT
jgi:hypothetical protein